MVIQLLRVKGRRGERVCGSSQSLLLSGNQFLKNPAKFSRLQCSLHLGEYKESLISFGCWSSGLNLKSLTFADLSTLILGI